MPSAGGAGREAASRHLKLVLKMLTLTLEAIGEAPELVSMHSARLLWLASCALDI